MVGGLSGMGDAAFDVAELPSAIGHPGGAAKVDERDARVDWDALEQGDGSLVVGGLVRQWPREVVGALADQPRVIAMLVVVDRTADEQRFANVEQARGADAIAFIGGQARGEQVALELFFGVACFGSRTLEKGAAGIQIAHAMMHRGEPEIDPRGDRRLGDGRPLPQAQLLEPLRCRQVGEAAVILGEPARPLLDARRHAEETQHPATVLAAGLVLARGETAQPFFDGLQIGGDVDRTPRALDEAVGERRPAAVLFDEVIHIVGPAKTDRWLGAVHELAVCSMMVDVDDKIAGGILGLLIGDAFGVPYEFRRPEQLPPSEALDFEPPAGFDRAHAGVPAGTWSDDGAQALCLLASLLTRGTLDVDDFAQRMVQWYAAGYMAVDGVVFDVGVGTAAALHAIGRGVPVLEAARSDERANGNGALMRVLPLALWHQGSDAALVEDAHLQSRVTHGHARSWVCAALYCLWVRYELDLTAGAGREDAWDVALGSLRAIYGDGPLSAELESHVRPDEPAEGRGSGYVVDCLHSARMVVAATTSYEDAVRAAVALGHDTDTTAAVAGGVAGVRYGLESIDARWRAALRGREMVDPLIEGICRYRRQVVC